MDVDLHVGRKYGRMAVRDGGRSCVCPDEPAAHHPEVNGGCDVGIES